MMVEPKTYIENDLWLRNTKAVKGHSYMLAPACSRGFFHVCGKPHSSERRSACVLSSALIKAR